KSRIAIVGAGVFGLSTAYHLAINGFTDVTVFDRSPYSNALYDQHRGCDAASADLNKILRASYGNRAEYQRLAYAAREEWKRWNNELRMIRKEDLPDGLEGVGDLYTECGFLRLSDSPIHPLSEKELAGLSNLEKQFPEYRLKNYIISDSSEEERARTDGWGHVLDSMNWSGTGVLDATAGYVRADKACVWLAKKARQAGVQFIEGNSKGNVVNLKLVESLESLSDSKIVEGVMTADGVFHPADLVIIAAGGWTPYLVPDTRKLLETTAGSIISIQLPPLQERPDLWDKYSGKNWPVVSQGHDAQVYSLPQIDGMIKIGYRGTKFTNYVSLPDNTRISVPVTAYTTPSQTHVPAQAIQEIKEFIRRHFPDLVTLGISYTRLCWYTDSIDNDFLIDYVPGYHKTLFVASGGSGHGFKFAPVLGQHVLDSLREQETDLTKIWRWRDVPQGRRNGLEEGEVGPRVLSKQTLATEADWKFTMNA
ncbi:hypothetical protein M422DRAFT_34130, partial [Sphaerobolus stellatus SS14]